MQERMEMRQKVQQVTGEVMESPERMETHSRGLMRANERWRARQPPCARCQVASGLPGKGGRGSSGEENGNGNIEVPSSF